MRIRHASVFVDDQAKALAFYTDVLGFVKKVDMPMGEFRWLTVRPLVHNEERAVRLRNNGRQATVRNLRSGTRVVRRLTGRVEPLPVKRPAGLPADSVTPDE